MLRLHELGVLDEPTELALTSEGILTLDDLELAIAEEHPLATDARLRLAAGILAPWNILLSPAFGALLMSVSTIIVAINAQLLRRTRLAAQ